MKRLLSLLSVCLLLSGCADKQTEQGHSNPYLPIAGLTIPRQGTVGEEVTMQGRGFAADCRIFLLLNGETSSTEVQVVHADETSVRFTIPGTLPTGFYVVILQQNGTTTRIGGINISGDSYEPGDFEIYVLAGERLEVYPASVSKQVVADEPLPDSGVKDLDFSGYVEALPDGMLYYTSYGVYVIDGWIKELYDIGSYNMLTGERTPPRQIEDFFAMGQIDGKFHLLKTDIKENRIYTLVEWSASGEREVRTFDFSAFGSARILVPDQRFVYYPAERVLLVYGNMGQGDSMAQSTFTLDLQTGEVFRTGNDANYQYAYAVAEDRLYCFATQLDDGDVVGTKVLRIDDVRRWSLDGEGATELLSVSGTGFDLPVYSSETGMIYGVNDQESFGTLLTFDPRTNSIAGKKWINPGIAGLFYAPQPSAGTE